MYTEKDETGKDSRDGFWEHKETGTVVHLVDDPVYGVPLTNSFEKAGYVFVGKDDPRTKVEAKTEDSVEVKPKTTTKK